MFWAKTSGGKIPEILSPDPTPKFGDFWGFPQRNPQNLSFPRPQSIPEYFKSSNPFPNPEIWGVSRMNPIKSPKLGLSLSPNYPRKF